MSAKSGSGADVRHQKSDARDWLVGGGEMGKLIRSMDWSKTGLSNRGRRAWGSKHVQTYNDRYWPICGEKHPGSMG